MYFQPIGAVGHLHGNPVSGAGLHSSVPVQAKSKQVAVEMIFRVAVVDQKSDVDHVAGKRGNRRCGHFGFAALDELNAMAFRIGHGDG